ncbi:uncharacterized protein LOC126856975 isoform X2 [Cataglyphis hispanica]|uniref:uncharacterized protein LOC126856975 isoform X2 n=1 Tax=Cataglyphis hispanica TaxID=1086592 RepID=UPI00217FD1E7|nr:uncharacterized protein LOC126856975 isoform X2 [Cataglyphis hispanica]
MYVIQAGVIPQGWFQHENLPNFINLLDLPSSFHDFSDHVATLATSALSGVRPYFDTFHTHLSDILPHNGILHRVINRIQSGLTNPAFLNGAADAVTNALASRVVPNTDYLRPGIFGRRLFGNNGGTDLGSNAAPAATANAASSAT